VRVEDVASTPRLALDGGLDKLERRLRRLRQSARQSKRRPKKYYAASRALAAG
jgi:ribosome-associated translation inhibitor RaiA